MSKYEVISGPNTGKYEPEITPYLDTFHAVHVNHNQEIIIRKSNVHLLGSVAALQSVLRKRFSENMQQIYRRMPMPKYEKLHFGMGVLL